MAKKQPQSKGTASKSFNRPKPTYINVSLTQADKDELAAFVSNGELPLTQLLDLVEMGFQFSLKTDSYGGGFRASLTDLDESSPTYNYCLSGRGSTATNAWFALAYRHFILLKEDWSSTIEPEGVSDFS